MGGQSVTVEELAVVEKGFKGVDEQFEAVNKRLGGIDTRLKNIEKSVKDIRDFLHVDGEQTNIETVSQRSSGRRNREAVPLAAKPR